jgi:predicted DNA-binding transcriptional regulator YafY
MGDSVDTLMRQWAMLRHIPRPPWRTEVAELVRRLAEDGFPTTHRTVERDLQRLAGQFPLVAETSAKPYGWSWAHDANFPFSPRLSASQGVALLLSRMHLRGLLPVPMFDDLAPVFEQAEREIASTGWKDWHRHTAVMPTGMATIAPTVRRSVVDAIHHALAVKRCVVGTYRSKGNDEPKEMKIHPLGILLRGPVQYLVCTLRDYNDIRHLALHRFTEVGPSGDPCVPPKDFDFAQYVASTGTKFRPRGEIALVARFAPAAADSLRDSPISKDQQVVEVDEGQHVELRATVADDETLRWWLRGFGARVQVLEPSDLRDEFRAELETALRAYA